MTSPFGGPRGRERNPGPLRAALRLRRIPADQRFDLAPRPAQRGDVRVHPEAGPKYDRPERSSRDHASSSVEFAPSPREYRPGRATACEFRAVPCRQPTLSHTEPQRRRPTAARMPQPASPTTTSPFRERCEQGAVAQNPPRSSSPGRAAWHTAREDRAAKTHTDPRPSNTPAVDTLAGPTTLIDTSSSHSISSC